MHGPQSTVESARKGKSREFEEGTREQVVHARHDLARVGDEARGGERILVELRAEQPTELLEIGALRRAARRRRTRLQCEKLLDERVPGQCAKESIRMSIYKENQNNNRGWRSREANVKSEKPRTQG